MEGAGHAFAHQQRLRGMFQHHRIARDQRRRDGVDRGHVGVVPRRHDEDDAMGHPLDIALERGVLAHGDIGQSLLRNRGHVAGAFVEAAKLAAVAHGAAHHAGQFGHDLVIHGPHGGDTRQNEFDPLGHRAGGPGRLRRAGAVHQGTAGRCFKRGALGENRAVDRRDAFQNAHARALSVCSSSSLRLVWRIFQLPSACRRKVLRPVPTIRRTWPSGAVTFAA